VGDRAGKTIHPVVPVDGTGSWLDADHDDRRRSAVPPVACVLALERLVPGDPVVKGQQRVRRPRGLAGRFGLSPVTSFGRPDVRLDHPFCAFIGEVGESEAARSA
jgi:hypothetical protein